MFLDTANIEDINLCRRSGVFKGITTNPTLLLKEKKSRSSQLESLLETDLELVFVQLVGSTVDELIKDYEALRKIKTDKTIGYKISMDFAGLEAASIIKKEDKNSIVLATSIYSADQGILAALAGCDYVAPYVNRMLNSGVDPFEAIKKMRIFYDDRGLKCKILAASFKNTSQIINALVSGSHTATIPPSLFLEMINKETSLNAIKVFNDHGEKIKKY